MPLRYSHERIVHLALNPEFIMQDVHSKGRRENKRQKVTRAVFSTELIVLRVRTFPNVHLQYELV